MAMTSRKYRGSLTNGALAAALNLAERELGLLIDLDVKASDTVASFNMRTPAPNGEVLVRGRHESPPPGASLVLFGEAIVDQRRQEVSVFRENDLATIPEDRSSRVVFGNQLPGLGITGPARF